MKIKINHKINIDKTENKEYNKTNIEIFTYKDYIKYQKCFGNENDIDIVQEETEPYYMYNSEQKK